MPTRAFPVPSRGADHQSWGLQGGLGESMVWDDRRVPLYIVDCTARAATSRGTYGRRRSADISPGHLYAPPRNRL